MEKKNEPGRVTQPSEAEAPSNSKTSHKPELSTPSTSQDSTNHSSEIKTIKTVLDEGTFKVPAPRPLPKKRVPKPVPAQQPKRHHKPLNKLEALRRMHSKHLSRKSDRLSKSRKVKTSASSHRVLPKPPTRKEVPKPRPSQQRFVMPNPNKVFDNLLLTDIKASMKPFRRKKRLLLLNKRFTLTSNVRLKHMDPLMLYGISLHRYANNMCEMIRVAELAIESNLIPPADPPPPVPRKFKLRQRHNTNCLNFMPKRLTSFSLGIGRALPEISLPVVREVLCQSVATIVGLLGFETTHESVLNVLVDVLSEFLRKIAYRFKLAYEDEQRGWLMDFPNIAERVLVELGIGNCRALHDYYQSRVIAYVKLLEKHCEELNKHYKNLITSKTPPAEDPKISDVAIKVEVEEEVVEIDTPQVQIVLNEELELPALDAGFQLLSSLEAGT